MKGIIRHFITTFFSTTLLLTLAIPANANLSYDFDEMAANQTSPISTATDIGLARPLGVAATVVGGGLFIISLPFSILGGNVPQAFHNLVGVQADTAFFRCLGCAGRVDTNF